MRGAQVRNLRPCIKVAIDFVSPESAPQCLALMRERRQLARAEMAAADGAAGVDAGDWQHADKLQAELILGRAAAAALAQLAG